MKRCLTIGIALAVLCGVSTLADARPPTVVNSPGYDARLRESRKALSASPTAAAPASASVAKPKRSKKHAN
ncbi:hypothetical protein SAMN05216338_103266 [Bradyrhizobium sp. Rc2d]|uniref:hypothetical protein n=1 Tax=Bradyrhizobium sp. Rc2d TaxID=1855321 RepID=UPI00088C0A50|nr:hypothetical protein [Bradyrhizobium sp. Rc2d]SDI87831.1 hypothetical protein SAMN05216338_103266 [Bradyrhizobium sp. Rc2d]